MKASLKKLAELIRACFRIFFQKPRDLAHVFGTAHFAARQIENPNADVRKFPAIDWQEIVPGPISFNFFSFPGIGSSISLVEGAALVALMKKVRAKRVFEFGTYKGVSTAQMAANLPPDGKIFTLDLPDGDKADVALYISNEKERLIAREAGKGSLIPKELLTNIIFLRQDSALFDPEDFGEKMDLVFVDGAHNTFYVSNDTFKGWQLLREGGVIAWHDCTPSHPEVVSYLQTLKPKVALVAGTTLAFAFKQYSSDQL